MLPFTVILYRYPLPNSTWTSPECFAYCMVLIHHTNHSPHGNKNTNPFARWMVHKLPHLQHTHEILDVSPTIAQHKHTNIHTHSHVNTDRLRQTGFSRPTSCRENHIRPDRAEYLFVPAAMATKAAQASSTDLWSVVGLLGTKIDRLPHGCVCQNNIHTCRVNVQAQSTHSIVIATRKLGVFVRAVNIWIHVCNCATACQHHMLAIGSSSQVASNVCRICWQLMPNISIFACSCLRISHACVE